MNSQECCQAQGMLLDLFLHFSASEPSWSTQLLLHGVVERGLHCFLPSIPLHSTSIKGNLEIVQFLIEKGAVVNAKDEDKQTAIHFASENGHIQIVQYLIEKGADVNAKDYYEQTALHFASEEGHLQIVQYLIEKGAEVNAKDDKGQTALNLALDPNIFSSKYADVTDAKAKKLLLASRKEIAKFLTSISK